MDTEQIKQLATDVNNVANAAFQSGKEYIERPLLAKIEQLEAELDKWNLTSAHIEEYLTFEKENKRLRAELDKHRWIPVGERLPEERKHREGFLDGLSKDVWVTDEKIIDKAFYNINTEKWICGQLMMGKITYWMPITLPQERFTNATV